MEDFEREHLKDSIYLIENSMEIEMEYKKWWSEINKLPAKINILGKPLEKIENETISLQRNT
jgi:hypothetical protein